MTSKLTPKPPPVPPPPNRVQPSARPSAKPSVKPAGFANGGPASLALPSSGSPASYLKPQAKPAVGGVSARPLSWANGGDAYVPSYMQKPAFGVGPSGTLPFMGASARKRRMELAAERGLQPPPPPPVQQQQRPPPLRQAPRMQAPRAGGCIPAWAPPGGKQGRGGGGAGAPAAAPPALPRGPPAVKWISLGEDAPLVLQGLPELAPVIAYDAELTGVLSSGMYVLYDLAGDEAASGVTMNHDAEWSTYREVGDAILAEGGEETPLCIAISERHGKWAVGLGSKWKRREQAARLALAVALAANAEELGRLAARYPEFIELCESAGITTGDDVLPGQEAAAGLLAPSWQSSKRRRKKKGQAGEGDDAEDPEPSAGGGHELYGGGPGPGRDDGKEDKLPRDIPLWITLPADNVPEPLEILPADALAVSTDGTGSRKGLYTSADAALAHIAGEVDVEYHDDFNWTTFPGVGAALKQVAKGEECITVAVCLLRAVWAVGISMKSKSRLGAAKVALAATLALQTAEMGEEVDLTEYPALAEFVEEARQARDQGSVP